MTNATFIALLAALAAVALPLSFHHLQKERWQFMATVPWRKREGGGWDGLNFTTYGAISATAALVSVFVYVVMLGSAGLQLPAILLSVLVFLAICAPAAKLIAWAIEKNKHTFTVGGASFVGILIMPAVVWLLNQVFARSGDVSFGMLPLMAAMGTTYIIGEGIGRLGCITFGCCWGKPLDDASPLLQRLFRRFHFRFEGPTRKIHYWGKLGAIKVVPVQAITSTLYVGVGIACVSLFLSGRYGLAFVLSILVSQVWRVLSEFLRADPRGGRKFTIYQGMAVAGSIYAIVLAAIFSQPGALVALDVNAGLALLWTPTTILALQALWLFMFFYMGASTVTGSSLHFFIKAEEHAHACDHDHEPALAPAE